MTIIPTRHSHTATEALYGATGNLPSRRLAGVEASTSDREVRKPHRSFPNCLPALGCAVVRVPFFACFLLSVTEGREN
jgi:hypothetical protein